MNAWLEEVSFRTGIAAMATVGLVVCGAIAAAILATSGSPVSAARAATVPAPPAIRQTPIHPRAVAPLVVPVHRASRRVHPVHQPAPAAPAQPVTAAAPSRGAGGHQGGAAPPHWPWPAPGNWPGAHGWPLPGRWPWPGPWPHPHGSGPGWPQGRW